MSKPTEREFHPLREKIHEIIFEADTPLGKLFDVALLFFIIGSAVSYTHLTLPTKA